MMEEQCHVLRRTLRARSCFNISNWVCPAGAAVLCHYINSFTYLVRGSTTIMCPIYHIMIVYCAHQLCIAYINCTLGHHDPLSLSSAHVTYCSA
eukprot:scaffold198313_cov35-Attheya_sp.AAC.2